MKKILVIIVTYNAMQWIEKCIKSVLSSYVSADIFIVDNGSKDGTVEYIYTNYPKILLKKSELNLGFGKANNIALQYALDQGYEYVYLLNQDAWVMPNTFEILIKVANKNPEFGILSPLQVQANMAKLDINFQTGVLCYDSCPLILNDLLLGQLSEIYEVRDVMAAHWLISKDCLLKTGGFSPSFPHYGEDINYAERVKYHGLKIGFVPKAIGVHDRENRNTPWRKKIYIDYIRCIRVFSSPFEHNAKLKFSMLRLLLADIIRYRSFLPFRYFTRLLIGMRDIINNRNISVKYKTAFLSYV